MSTRVSINGITDNPISWVVYLVIGYLVGAMLSDHIFMNLTQTDWASAWTYLWIFFWPIGIAIVFWVWFAVIAAGAFVIFLLVEGFKKEFW